MLESIGNRIKIAIKASGLTQSSVAEQCGVSKQAITGWIKNSSIDKKNLMQLSKITKTEFSWLLDGTKKGKPINPGESNGVSEKRAHYNQDETELLDNYRKLSPDNKARLTAIVKALTTKLDKKTNS